MALTMALTIELALALELELELALALALALELELETPTRPQRLPYLLPRHPHRKPPPPPSPMHAAKWSFPKTCSVGCTGCRGDVLICLSLCLNRCKSTPVSPRCDRDVTTVAFPLFPHSSVPIVHDFPLGKRCPPFLLPAATEAMTALVAVLAEDCS